MKKITKQAVFVVLASIIINIAALPALASDDISIVLNGVPVQTDVAPFMQDGRTLVPVRAVAEALDFYVDWRPDIQEIVLMGDITVFLSVNNTTAKTWQGAGYEVEYTVIDAPPIIVDGITFVPLRFLAESLDIDVEWNEATRTVILTADTTPSPQPQAGGYLQFPSIPIFSSVTGVERAGAVTLPDGSIRINYGRATSEQIRAYANELERLGFRFDERASDISVIRSRRNGVIISEEEQIRRLVYIDEANNLEVMVISRAFGTPQDIYMVTAYQGLTLTEVRITPR